MDDVNIEKMRKYRIIAENVKCELVCVYVIASTYTPSL